MRFLAIAIGLLVISHPSDMAWADGADNQHQVRARQSVDERHQFFAQLALTADEQTLRKTWDTASENPQLQVTNSVRVGSDVTTVLIFRGCTPNLAGQCDVTVEFSLVKPNGDTVKGGMGNLWSSAPLLNKFMLGAASMTLAFNTQDDVGDYQVRARVVDRISARTVELSTLLRVEAGMAAR